jgi:hypothetical protein
MELQVDLFSVDRYATKTVQARAYKGIKHKKTNKEIMSEVQKRISPSPF